MLFRDGSRTPSAGSNQAEPRINSEEIYLSEIVNDWCFKICWQDCITPYTAFRTAQVGAAQRHKIHLVLALGVSFLIGRTVSCIF